MENRLILEKLKASNVEALKKITLDENGNLVINGDIIQESKINWDNTKITPYKKNAVVIHNNNLYQCIVSESNVGTFVITEWQLIGVSSDGVKNLNELTDTNILNPINKQGLLYDSENSKWTNQTISTTDEKVKASVSATSQYLDAIVDGTTCVISNDKLVVKTLDSLNTTLAELNFIKGLDKNIMTYMNAISNPITIKAIVNTYADISTVLSPVDGNLVLVKIDETHSNKQWSYVYINGVWTSLNETIVTVRDFSINPINLNSEVSGILPQVNMDLTGVSKTSDLTVKVDKVIGAVSGDIATLDTNGNLVDGGKKIADLVQTSRTINGKSLINDITLSKLDIGLNNVKNFDTTDASNITSGILPSAQLPIANSTNIGGVKAGTNITITTDGTISSEETNVKPTNYLYVAKNGNDTTGDGSANKPFLNIQSAINSATSGTTIFIFPGTYNENLTFKAGVYLTASVKYGVYIRGNHIVDYIGTCIVENIVLNSSSGITLSFQGINAQNFQLLSGSIDSATGHAISYTNTNASSKIYSEDSITTVSASSSTAKCFYSPSTAKGSVILNRYTFRVNNPDNIALDIGGNGLSFTHTGDQIIGQIVVNNSASTTFASLSTTTLNTPILTTNSIGMTTMINTVINTTSNPVIAGVGAFSYVAILYANTGVSGASSLNGGLGAIVLPMSSLKLRNSSLIPSAQISAGLNNGSFEFTGDSLYFTKNNTRYEVSMGENNEHEKVDVLPTTNIDINKIYLLTTDKSINIYNGTTWDKYGGTSGSIDINTLPTF